MPIHPIRSLRPSFAVWSVAGLALSTALPSALAQCPSRSWQPVGAPGLDATARAAAVYNNQLIVGGDFLNAGGQPASCIARWDGASWAPLDSGMDQDVRALALFGGDLIAGGRFNTAGSGSVNGIARWNGTYWAPLGGGVGPLGGPTGGVRALAVYNNELVAAGGFTTAVPLPVRYIARWDGTNWSPVGTGVDGVDSPINAMTVYNGLLIAGGSFAEAGGQPANFIASWNGTSWAALGSGMTGFVDSLTVYNDDLIAGGDFTEAGGQPASRVARWNGSAWSALGDGVTGALPTTTVSALTTFGGDLIVGGEFTAAAGLPARNLARWNGSTWSLVGTAANAKVHALTLHDLEPVAVGEFTSADGHTVNRVASWECCPAGGCLGRCCFLDGSCQVLTPEGCVVQGGAYAGNSTDCSTSCPQPGACCAADGTCTYVLQSLCTTTAATWAGPSVACSAVTCPHVLITPNPSLTSSIAGSGIFFDLSSTSAVSVFRIDYFPSAAAGAPVTVDLYTVPGTYVGNDTNQAAWTHLGTVSTTSVGGTTNPTALTLPTPIAVGSGGSVGVYLVGTTGGYRFRSSTSLNPVTDGALSLESSLARTAPFAGTASIRRFAGRIHYTQATTCYANCDSSTTAPALNVQDFGCFLTRYAAGEPYANCDDSTTPPILNVQDFGCFLTKYAAGCP